jgi:steroid delta-isomerase-like uncharacterized protein
MSQSSQSVVAFLKAYGEHDVETMVELCTDNADFRYVPSEIVRKQRVIRGEGKVRGVGKTYWIALIDAFPDLSNKVTNLIEDGNGNVAAEVVFSGTQGKDFGTLANQQGHYDLPHLFLFHVDRDGLIDDIVTYWDTANWYRQLGRVECD